ncbi:hypothetical protein QWY20_12355 [Alkalimonas sp. MEB108]|uniref:Uncharacterized protein n=1 Tax=Alkalimonas cellulosilytica TaxID=3058395 RepID=A0ABU7J715_9GAMM|nr:hypothetical protein [Alkalimonas sp. MEB108]MEE2002247.1 hypothetical protein [Alkalimonas sp. MEB108]
MQLDLESIVALFIGIAFLNWAIAMICFGRITVRYLDRELIAQGFDMHESDGLGMRFPWYASAILSNRPERQPFVPGEAIMRIRRRKDIFLARWISWSFWLFFIPSVVCFLWLKGWLWF